MADNGMSPTSAELGIPPPLLPMVGMMPPLEGQLPLATFETFAAIQNFANRTFRWNYDQALETSYQSAIAMASDASLWGPIRKRQVPVTQLEIRIEAQEKSDSQELQAAEATTKCLRQIPDFQQFQRCLLDAEFYGRYGVQYNTTWKFISGHKFLTVNKWAPVNGDKIIFHWDAGPGVLVNGAACTKPVLSTDRGLAHFLTQEEQELMLIHKFEPTDADFWRSWEGAQIFGLGFRGRLFYTWWLRSNLTQIWFDFMQKVSTGFTIFYYELGNRASRQAVIQAVANQPNQNVFIYPRSKDGTSAYGAGVERKEVSMSGAEMLYKVYELLTQIMEDYIMQETLTTGTGATGLGSGVAEAHEGTAESRTRYDANDLDSTLQNFVNAFYRWNFPGVTPGIVKHVVDKPDVAEVMEAVSFFVGLGGSVGANYLRDMLGIPEPEEGEEVLTKLSGLQPAALNMNPQETPIAGSPMPTASVGGQPQPDQTQGQPQQQGAPGMVQQSRLSPLRFAKASTEPSGYTVLNNAPMQELGTRVSSPNFHDAARLWYQNPVSYLGGPKIIEVHFPDKSEKIISSLFARHHGDQTDRYRREHSWVDHGEDSDWHPDARLMDTTHSVQAERDPSNKLHSHRAVLEILRGVHPSDEISLGSEGDREALQPHIQPFLDHYFSTGETTALGAMIDHLRELGHEQLANELQPHFRTAVRMQRSFPKIPLAETDFATRFPKMAARLARKRGKIHTNGTPK